MTVKVSNAEKSLGPKHVLELFSYTNYRVGDILLLMFDKDHICLDVSGCNQFKTSETKSLSVPHTSSTFIR